LVKGLWFSNLIFDCTDESQSLAAECGNISCKDKRISSSASFDVDKYYILSAICHVKKNKNIRKTI